MHIRRGVWSDQWSMGGPRGYFHDGMMWSEAKNIEQSRSDELLSSHELVEGQNSMNVSS